MHTDTIEAQQDRGTTSIGRHMKATRLRLDHVFTLHSDGWVLVIGINCLLF